MSNTALITGASSGLGAEFARYHASKGGDLVITARREPELNALKGALEQRYGITVHVIALDLAAPGGAENLYQAVKQTGAKIDILKPNSKESETPVALCGSKTGVRHVTRSVEKASVSS